MEVWTFLTSDPPLQHKDRVVFMPPPWVAGAHELLHGNAGVLHCGELL